MPRRATARPPTRRPAPYQLRSINNNHAHPTSVAMTVSPMVSWDPIASQHHGYVPAPHQSHYDHYSQQVLLHDYQPIPTTISAAPPVQHVRAPIYNDSHSHAHFTSNTNTGSGPWTAEMDDILIENHKRMKWDQIAEKYFHNTKTGNACRKRHARVMSERKEPSKWAPERVNKVIGAYKRGSMRERMWKLLADEVGESWEHVEKLCLNQGLKAMTREEGFGHTRRRSQAPSHRSHHSINSDNGHNDGFDDEANDDSGLGGELQNTNLRPVRSQAYTPHNSTYHNDISGSYEPDSYHFR